LGNRGEKQGDRRALTGAVISDGAPTCSKLCNATSLRQIATILGSGRQSSATTGPHRAHVQRSRSATCARWTPFLTGQFRKSQEAQRPGTMMTTLHRRGGFFAEPHFG